MFDIPAMDVPVGRYRQYQMERVIHGRPFDEALAEELEAQNLHRIFVIAANGSEENLDLSRVRQVLGKRFAGEYSNVPPHTPKLAIIDAAKRVKAAGADHIVAIGGGSVIDAAKAIAYCVSTGQEPGQAIGAMHDIGKMDPSRRAHEAKSWLRISAIPMTLSAAECTYFSGVTDEEHRIKNLVAHPWMIPQAVIYDPRLTLSVRLPVFLATGVKAIDHAAEKLAAKSSHPMSDATATHALKLLVRGLEAVARHPDDLAARLDCQLGAWLSMVGGSTGVRTGASHALGHSLGAHTSVAHGLTSCVLLASVMRWNKPANGTEQRRVSDALGQADADAGDLIESLVMRLKLAHRLSTLGIRKSELPVIAEKSLKDPGMLNNPRAVRDARDVLEILNMAW